MKFNLADIEIGKWIKVEEEGKFLRFFKYSVFGDYCLIEAIDLNDLEYNILIVREKENELGDCIYRFEWQPGMSNVVVKRKFYEEKELNRINAIELLKVLVGSDEIVKKLGICNIEELPEGFRDKVFEEFYKGK